MLVPHALYLWLMLMPTAHSHAGAHKPMPKSPCPATPRRVSRASMGPVRDVDRRLGIPADYVRTHHLQPQRQARQLVAVQPENGSRKVRMVMPAARALAAMVKAADHDGVTLQTVSGFRSWRYQAGLIRAKLRHGMSIRQALAINAVPGYSEHESGCAIDLTTPGVTALGRTFARSTAFHWLQQHADHYGFHLSFRRDNRYGYEYEPWHWRYVAPLRWHVAGHAFVLPRLPWGLGVALREWGTDTARAFREAADTTSP